MLLANSSFTYFPVFTSDTVKYVIAPKYWARHNVSDGYWASEQNIYEGWYYQDRNGELFSAEECRKELDEYKKSSLTWKTHLNKTLDEASKKEAQKKADGIYKKYILKRRWYGLLNKLRKK